MFIYIYIYVCVCVCVSAFCICWNGIACNKYIYIQMKIEPHLVLKIFIYSLFSGCYIVAMCVGGLGRR